MRVSNVMWPLYPPSGYFLQGYGSSVIAFLTDTFHISGEVNKLWYTGLGQQQSASHSTQVSVSAAVIMIHSYSKHMFSCKATSYLYAFSGSISLRIPGREPKYVKNVKCCKSNGSSSWPKYWSTECRYVSSHLSSVLPRWSTYSQLQIRINPTCLLFRKMVRLLSQH